MHRSVDDPVSPAAPEPEPTAEPVARSPVEAIPEILEQLLLKQREMVAELLAELARADTATLAKLFGAPSALGCEPLRPDYDRRVIHAHRRRIA